MFKSRISVRFPLLMLFLAAIWLTSCRSGRELPVVRAKPISTGKLLKKVEENAFSYENLSIKRINCQFSSSNSKTTFKINLKAVYDKQILVSITKLNIPVGKVLLTPDSVKYVNYIDKNYFIDDYSYLSDLLNIDLDFETIQSVISNNAFSYRNDPKNKDFKSFVSFIEDGKYVLQSEKKRRILKLDEKWKPEKIERRLKRREEEALILQKMYFEPSRFSMTRLLIVDKTNDRQMEMNFSNFENVNNRKYPGAIDISIASRNETIGMKIRLSGFSTEDPGAFNIDIPEKYEQIIVN